MNWEDRAEIGSMVGETFIEVRQEPATKGGNEELVFACEDGRQFIFTHDQDCCESVGIEDIAGDLSDLVGHPLLVAEEVSNQPEPEWPEGRWRDDSHTWTFYKFSTIRGSVTVRWLGESNGYYSESVDLYMVAE